MFTVLNCSGGRHCKRPVKAFEVYDTEMRSWTTLPTMPCKRSYGGIIWDPDGRLCLLGGLRQGGGHQSSKFTKNVNIFDSNQGTNSHCLLILLLVFSFFSAHSSPNRDTPVSSKDPEKHVGGGEEEIRNGQAKINKSSRG